MRATRTRNWKPPAGYKSAIGKARDAFKAAALKKKSGKVSALRDESEDTASEDEYSNAGDFSIHAVTSTRFQPVSRGIRMSEAKVVQPADKPMCALGRFAGLDEQQEYDPKVIESLNTWTHAVKEEKDIRKQKKTSLRARDKIDRTVNYVNSNQNPTLATS